MRKILNYIFCLLFLSCSAQEEVLDLLDMNSFNKQNVSQIIKTTIFDSKDIPGKPYSRIPTIIIANNSNILAACEKRKVEDDKGEIDILLALSQDGGKTYTKKVLFENDKKYGRKMNPCFVIDRNGTHGNVGRIYCFAISILPLDKRGNQLSPGESNTLYRYSDDSGVTWSDIHEFGNKIPSECIVFGPSPANGIQLKNGTLVIPAFIYHSDKSLRTGIIFKSPNSEWKFNYINTDQSQGENECTIIEYGNGNQILLNVRVENNIRARRVYYSNIIEDTPDSNNITWNIHPSSAQFPSPDTCQGSLEPVFSDLQPLYLFSYPSQNPRKKICIWKSSDLASWKPIYYLTTGRSAGYSVLSYYKDKLLAIYESDSKVLECSIQDLSPLLPLLTEIGESGQE